MKHLFVPFEIALKLKELGFVEPCIAFYSYETSEIYPVMQEPTKGSHFNTGNFLVTLRAPLFQQVFDWFREKHNLAGCIDCLSKEFVEAMPEICEKPYRVHITHTIKSGVSVLIEFDTYEEAQIACLEKLIEIVKP